MMLVLIGCRLDPGDDLPSTASDGRPSFGESSASTPSFVSEVSSIVGGLGVIGGGYTVLVSPECASSLEPCEVTLLSGLSVDTRMVDPRVISPKAEPC